MKASARRRVQRWRIGVAAFFATALVAALYPVTPAMAASPIHSGQFKGVNWADPRDNFADDAVVPSGLSTDDGYATTYAKAKSVLQDFRNETGANTVRLPINPYSVGTKWWRSYTGAINAASNLGFRVVLSYWEGTGANKDGRVDDRNAFWSMWDTVTRRYAGDGHIYFDPMNEPHGYTLQQWTDLASSWLERYPAIPRNRVFISGSGYDDDVTGVCADNRLDGTYLALHDYAFWGSKDYQGWMDDLKGRIGTCANRTVLEEFGVPMTTGLDYDGSSTSGDAESNDYIAFLQAATDTTRSLHMGSVYWPGLRTGDTYSLTTLNGTGTDLSLTLNNRSGLDRIAWGWGRVRTGHQAPS